MTFWKNQMRLLFLLFADAFVVKYILGNTIRRHYGVVPFRDVLQQTYGALYRVHPIRYPVDHRDPRIREVLREVSTFRQRERRLYSRNIMIRDEYQMVHEGMDPHLWWHYDGLTSTEDEVCRRIMYGQDTAQILIETGLPFQEFTKIRERVRRKFRMNPPVSSLDPF